LIADLASTVSSLGKKLADENTSIDPGVARIENFPLLPLLQVREHLWNLLPPLLPFGIEPKEKN